MKRVIKLPVIILFALTVLLAVSVYGFSGGKIAKAVTNYYSFYVAKYDVTFDVSDNCLIDVTEDLTIAYTGRDSTGFKRDIPVNGGAQVRDVAVSQIVGGEEKYVWYDVYYEDNDFLTVDIGDYGVRKYGTEETYRITYQYIITNSVANSGFLPLNPIGHGWECYIYDASVKLILPDGYINAVCYIGDLGSTTRHDFSDSERTADGRVIISANVETIPPYCGLTFDINFNKGAIKSYTDLTPLLFVLAGIILLAILIVLKFLAFNKNYLTPVVNYEAPDKMDPLIMGKLIDNKVNKEDVTSLIYYWANKGYIKINLDDKKDPTLIRVTQELPEPCPTYERLMYNSLFMKGDVVKTSQLKNKFFKTVDQVTSIVNKQTTGLYEKKSFVVSIIFTLLGGLLLGIAPLVLAFTRISNDVLNFSGFSGIIFAILVYFASLTLMYNRLKLKKNSFILCCAAIALLCVVLCVFYVIFVPSSIIGITAKILLFGVCSLIFALSLLLVTRTKSYTDKLNDIIGFKNFIELAEKDQLEMMLEENPQFYYNVLPYAQVLGVTDKWEEKFSALTVQPPRWITGNIVTTYIEFRVLSGIINTSMRNISSGMISRPSSSGANGGGRGGFHGGFSGGGFGGGGGRGR